MTIPKAQLEHGAHYIGVCRNARVARWNEGNQRFYYWRTKFGRTYVMRLPHEEDQRGFDFFQPWSKASWLDRLAKFWANTAHLWLPKRLVALLYWLWKRRFTIPFRTDAGDDG